MPIKDNMHAFIILSDTLDRRLLRINAMIKDNYILLWPYFNVMFVSDICLHLLFIH